MTSSPAFCEIGGERQLLPPHQAALFSSDCVFRYGACDGFYSNDWIIFSSDEAWVTHFPVIGRFFPISDYEYCHRLFQLLTWEFRQDHYETVISQLLSVLFHRLEREINHSDTASYSQELLSVRRRMILHPQESWTVNRMADMLHISPGYFQMIYRKQFHISCMEDVIRNRIRMARDYLSHTSLNVSEIALLCGYRSSEHFNRQFHRVAGVSPGAFRKQAQAVRAADESPD